MHDEENASKEGDQVEIAECRPRSRTKRCEVVRAIHAADQVAGEAARAQAAADEELQEAVTGSEPKPSEDQPVGESQGEGEQEAESEAGE